MNLFFQTNNLLILSEQTWVVETTYYHTKDSCVAWYHYQFGTQLLYISQQLFRGGVEFIQDHVRRLEANMCFADVRRSVASMACDTTPYKSWRMHMLVYDTCNVEYYIQMM